MQYVINNGKLTYGITDLSIVMYVLVDKIRKLIYNYAFEHPKCMLS